ncbi:hypothetical protein JVU11DRAFT_10880 [Chiua virens]|nr:hypothetical protein JVU11DRAFT_10880 [Chiua virens]
MASNRRRSVLVPDFKPYCDSFYKEKIDKTIGMLALVTGYTKKGLGVSISNLDRLSRIVRMWTLTPGFLSKYATYLYHLLLLTKFICGPSDVALFTWMYKKSRELGRRLPSYRGEVPGYHPKFSSGSVASVKEADNPVPANAPDIKYTKEDNDAIRAFHRAMGESFQQWSGPFFFDKDRPRCIICFSCSFMEFIRS